MSVEKTIDNIELIRLSLSKALDMIVSNKIKDARTSIALMKLALDMNENFK